MLKTIETQSDAKLRKPTQFLKPRQTFVTIFSEELHVPEIALLSEVALGEHWLRPEEDTTQVYHQSE